MITTVILESPVLDLVDKDCIYLVGDDDCNFPVVGDYNIILGATVCSKLFS